MKTLDKERFWQRVGGLTAGPDDCWEWIASKVRGGYGQFKVKGRLIVAHRFSWILHYGPIPKGLQVLHGCDNPPCVNPTHLFLGTQLDNVEDMISKDRRASTSGELNGYCKLSDTAVKIIREICNSGLVGQRAIADFYDVTQTAVSLIHRGKRRKRQQITTHHQGAEK